MKTIVNRKGPKGLPPQIRWAIQRGLELGIPKADIAYILGLHKQTVYKFVPFLASDKLVLADKVEVWQHRAIYRAKKLTESNGKALLKILLTQTALAKMLGIHRKTVAEYGEIPLDPDPETITDHARKNKA